MAQQITAPARLPDLVRAAFTRALTDGELTYFATQVTEMPVGRATFQIRYSPALSHKPVSNTTNSNTNRTAVDPFEYPSPAAANKLFVTDVGASHFLVLNKFAVVPRHAILATAAYRPQTGLLDAADLAATMACLRAYEDDDDGEDSGGGGGKLFAFFNSGVHSGASQPHRHIQLLPVAAMRHGLPPTGSRWHVLADQLSSDDDGNSNGNGNSNGVVAPFRTFVAPISLDSGPDELLAKYRALYARAVVAVRGADHPHANVHITATTSSEEIVDAAISYNLAMTRDRIVLCPRLADGSAIVVGGGSKDGKEDGDDCSGGDSAVGRLSLNGTLLAGTALVRTEAEWDALRRHPGALVRALRRVGLPQPDFVEGGGE